MTIGFGFGAPPRHIAGALAIVASVLMHESPASAADAVMAARIREVAPALEAYIEKGMKDFGDPGLAIGIVHGDTLVYARGFGVRRKGGEPVTVETVFQIGS